MHVILYINAKGDLKLIIVGASYLIDSSSAPLHLLSRACDVSVDFLNQAIFSLR